VKLSQDQVKKLIEKLNELNINSCSICKSKKILVSDTVFEVREFKKGALDIGSSK
jgi:hypothetical protein